jgi:hypothetical protein
MAIQFDPLADKGAKPPTEHQDLPTEAAPPVNAVLRHCKVCEWEGEVIEAEAANPDCPWCHGPTERKATLAVATGPVPAHKNPHAAALGRLGGLKGGRARAEALTPAQRRKIASRAARARWRKRDSES